MVMENEDLYLDEQNSGGLMKTRFKFCVIKDCFFTGYIVFIFIGYCLNYIVLT